MLRYEEGLPSHPISPGRRLVEIDRLGVVRLTYERLGQRRVWTAKQEVALWPALVSALDAARFPEVPKPQVVQPDTVAASIDATTDGRIVRVTLVPCAEYARFRMLMNEIVAQMTGTQILGFELKSEQRYVTHVREEAV